MFKFTETVSLEANRHRSVATLVSRFRKWRTLCMAGVMAASALAVPGALAQADSTAPRVEFVTASLYTNADSQIINLEFNEPVLNIDAGDFTVVGSTATITDFSNPFGNSYRFEISGGDLADIPDTDLSLGLAPGQDITDAAGNALTTIVSLDGWTHINVNNTRPVPAFTSAAVAPVSQPFTVNLDFTPQNGGWEDSIISFGFDESILQVGNGTVESFTNTTTPEGFLTGATIVVRPVADGPVTIDLPENQVYDEASNQNTAATQFSINADVEVPEPIIFKPGIPCPCTGPITARISFSEGGIAGFDVNDLVVTGATLSDFTFNGLSGTVLMTPTGDGTMTLDLPAGSVVDADGFPNTAAAQFSAVVDTTRPTVTLTTAAAAPVTGEFDLDITFSEPMTNVGNTAVWTLTNASRLSVTGSGANYVMRVRPQSGAQGTITLDLAENGFSDAAGNGVVAPDQFSIEFDRANPRIASIERFDPSEATTNADSLTFTVTFSEDVTNVDTGDFDIYTADFAPANTTASVSDVTPVSASVYRVTVSGGNLASLNNTSITLNGRTDGNIRDAADNVMTVGSPQTPPEGYTMDNSAPVLTSIARQTPAGEQTNADSLTWRVTFSETVSNVDAGDFDVSGSTASVTDVSPVIAGDAPPGISEPMANPDSNQYLVTVSGGDLADADSSVGLDLAAGQDIADGVGNALANSEPATDETYDVRNTGPAIASIVRSTPAAALTNADSLTWRVTFSAIDNAFDLPANAFTVSGTTGTITNVSRFSIGFDVTVSGGDLADLEGDVTLGLTDSDFFDDYGNLMDRTIPAGAELTYTLDNTVPTVEITSTEGPLVNGDFDITITFSEPVTGFDVNELVRVNTGRYNFSGSGAVYTVTMAPNGTPFTIDIPAGAAQDAAGNGNTAATQYVGTLDTTRPDVTATTIGTVDRDGTLYSRGAFTVNFTFTEPAFDLSLDDFLIDGGTVSNLTGSGTSWSVTVTPDANSQVEFTLPTNSYTDEAGNGGLGASLQVNDDQVAPRVFNLRRLNPADAVTSADTLVWEFRTNENTTGVDAADFVVQGTTATIAGITSDAGGYVYEITVSGGDLADLNGDVTLALAPGQNITDRAGNPFEDTQPFGTNTPTFTVDNAAPSLAVTGPASPVAGAFTATFTFSEDITGFGIGDISVVNGAATDFQTTIASAYTATITPSADGDVTINVADDAAQDAAANGSLAAPQYSVRNDETAPVLTAFARNTPANEQTDADTLVFSISFDESVANVSADDFVISGTSATGVLGGAGAAYTLTLSGGDLANLNGVIGINLARGQDIVDAAGNPLADGEPVTDETYSVLNDAEPPRVTSIFRAAPTIATPTQSDTLNWQVTFNEAVANVDAGDFAVTGSTATVTNVAASDAQTYVLTIGGGDLADFNGFVYLGFAAGQDITDVAGNALGNTTPTGSNVNYFRLDHEPPVPVLSASAAETVNASFTVAIRFSDYVDTADFTLEDIVVGNGTASNLVAPAPAAAPGLDAPAALERSYSVLITPTADGPVTVDIPAGVVSDFAGNENTAATQLSRIHDATAPRVASIFRAAPTITTPTQSDTLNWQVRFNEAVANVDTGDFAVTGSTATVTNVTASDERTFVVTIGGGDLAGFNGFVYLGFAAGQDIADVAGNALGDTTPTGSNVNFFRLDHEPPVPTLSTSASTPVAGPFTVAIRFSDYVDTADFTLEDIVVGNGTASNLAVPAAAPGLDGPTALERNFTVLITPTADGPVTVDIPAGVVSDFAGNENTAATQLAVENRQDRTLVVSLAGVGSGTVTGANGVIDCGTTCTADLPLGSEITLTAAAADGSSLASWTAGPCAGTSEASCSFTLSQDQTVTARFTLDTPPDGRIVAATLPAARSGQVGGPVMTAFVSVVSRASTPAQSCTISAPGDAPFTLQYREVDANNVAIGGVDPLFDIDAGTTLGFVMAMTPTAETGDSGYEFAPVITCQNANLDPIVGVNTILLNIGSVPEPDLLSISSTPSGDGVIRIANPGGAGVMSASVVNVGAGDGTAAAGQVTLTATVDTGAVVLPLSAEICQINASAQCVTPRGATVTTVIDANTPVFFAAFVRDQSAGGIAFEPATARVFLRFADGNGVTRSATSAAVTSPAPADAPQPASSLPTGRWSVLLRRQAEGESPSLVRGSVYVDDSGRAVIDDGISPRADNLQSTEDGFVIGDHHGRYRLDGFIRAGTAFADAPGEFWGARDARGASNPDWSAFAGRYGAGVYLTDAGELRGQIDGCSVYARVPGTVRSPASIQLSGCAHSGDYTGWIDLPANDAGAAALVVANEQRGWRLDAE